MRCVVPDLFGIDREQVGQPGDHDGRARGSVSRLDEWLSRCGAMRFHLNGGQQISPESGPT
jgi:hypothetical protein